MHLKNIRNLYINRDIIIIVRVKAELRSSRQLIRLFVVSAREATFRALKNMMGDQFCCKLLLCRKSSVPRFRLSLERAVFTKKQIRAFAIRSSVITTKSIRWPCFVFVWPIFAYSPTKAQTLTPCLPNFGQRTPVKTVHI